MGKFGVIILIIVPSNKSYRETVVHYNEIYEGTFKPVFGPVFISTCSKLVLQKMKSVQINILTAVAAF